MELNILAGASLDFVYIILYGFSAACSFVVFVATFVKIAEKFPRWIRVAYRMLGPIGLVWPVIGFVRLFASTRFSPHAQNLLENMQQFFAGLGVGILLLIVFSGELNVKEGLTAGNKLGVR